MEELRFSVDEEIYDDRHGHVLSRTGWYVPADGQTPEFRFLGDGEEIAVPAPERYPRPDVVQALDRDLGEWRKSPFRLRKDTPDLMWFRLWTGIWESFFRGLQYVFRRRTGLHKNII